MEVKTVDRSDKWTRPTYVTPSPRPQARSPAAYLPPVTALCLAPLSPPTPCRAPREAGWWAQTVVRIYGAGVVPLPTRTVGRGGRIRFLLGKHFHRKHLSNVSRAVRGLGSVRQDLLLSCSPGRAKAVGFLWPVHTLSVSWPVFSRPAEWWEQRTDPRTPWVHSILFNKQGFCQPEPWGSCKPEPCNEMDCPDPSRRNADKEMPGKDLSK